jgi:hypothetical protein
MPTSYLNPAAEPAPRAKAEAADAPPGVFGRIKLALAGAIFLQRIGLNQSIGGQVFPFPLSLFIMPLVLIWNLAKGVAIVPLNRLGPFVLFVVAILISTLLSNGGASITSALLIAGIYAMFVCPIALEEPAYKRFFRLIANIAAFVCVLGSLTYVIQFAFKADWLFSWRHVVPKQFLIEFNTLNMMRWPSEVYKANGFFLMEASYQSQLASRALLIAIFILRDPRYLIPLGLGLLTAYSGTGIVLFLIFGVLPLMGALWKNKHVRALMPIGLLMLPVVLMLFWTKLDLGLFVERLNEFSDPRTSAYARFVNSQNMLRIFSGGDALTFLFGSGPGSSEVFGAQMHSVGEATTSTWIKLLLEYGAFGFVVFLVFFYTCCLHTLRSHWLATAFTFHYFLLDSGFAVPQQAFITLVLGAYVCMKPSAQPANAKRAPETLAPAPA